MSVPPSIVNGIFNPNDFSSSYTSSSQGGSSGGYVTLDYLEQNYPDLTYFGQQLALKYNVLGGLITGLASDSVGFSGPSAVLSNIVVGNLTGTTGSFTNFAYTSSTGGSSTIGTLSFGSATGPSAVLGNIVVGNLTGTTGSFTNFAYTSSTGGSSTIGTLSYGSATGGSETVNKITANTGSLTYLSVSSTGTASVGINALSLTGPYSISLPAGQASSQSYLMNNTGGQLVWQAPNIVTVLCQTGTSFVNSSFTGINLMSLSITPSRTSSMVHFQASTTLIGTTTANCYLTAYRGSTNLASGSVEQAFCSSGGGDCQSAFISVYDSPATISATTYTLHSKLSSGTGTVGLGAPNLNSVTTYLSAEEIFT